MAVCRGKVARSRRLGPRGRVPRMLGRQCLSSLVNGISVGKTKVEQKAGYWRKTLNGRLQVTRGVVTRAKFR